MGQVFCFKLPQKPSLGFLRFYNALFSHASLESNSTLALWCCRDSSWIRKVKQLLKWSYLSFPTTAKSSLITISLLKGNWKNLEIGTGFSSYVANASWWWSSLGIIETSHNNQSKTTAHQRQLSQSARAVALLMKIVSYIQKHEYVLFEDHFEK